MSLIKFYSGRKEGEIIMSERDPVQEIFQMTGKRPDQMVMGLTPPPERVRLDVIKGTPMQPGVPMALDRIH